jgi:hypothetical protein
MKKNTTYLGVFGVFIGIVLSRFAVAKYGGSARAIIMIAVMAISILCLLGIIYSKKYLAALGTLSMIVPLAIMTIGIYLNNMYLGAFGFGLIFILVPIMIRIISKKKE